MSCLLANLMSAALVCAFMLAVLPDARGNAKMTLSRAGRVLAAARRRKRD